ncbi:DUF2057 family protein [Vibrio plantisponsor]|uniref:YccT family protein n=1 Tax=Vibrio plantisponsor TaxID=664643 RepID=UPI00370BCAEC
MTNKLWAVLVAAFSFSGISVAASIIPSSGVSILYVNGQPAEEKLAENQLKDGFNQVVVRMDKNMAPAGASSSDVFTSRPYVLNIDDVHGDLKIDHPQARSKMEADKAFKSDQPNWLVEQDGKAISFKQEVLKGKSGLFPYLGMEKLIAEHNQSRGIYFENGQVVDQPVAVQVAKVTENSAASDKAPKPQVITNNVEQLKAWYLQSSTEERKAFRRWMIDQE